MYKWRIDPSSRLVVVSTDGGPEWILDTTELASLVESVHARWHETVAPIAAKFGLPPEGIEAQICQESAGNPRAFRQEPNGWTGIGLLQITHPSLKGGHSDAELFDPALNIEIGARYTADLARKYRTPEGLPDWPRVFASFNAGSPRPNPKSQWNLFCYGNHVDAEVKFYNHLRLMDLNETQRMVVAAVGMQFDMQDLVDVSPHHDRDDA